MDLWDDFSWHEKSVTQTLTSLETGLLLKKYPRFGRLENLARILTESLKNVLTLLFY